MRNSAMLASDVGEEAGAAAVAEAGEMTGTMPVLVGLAVVDRINFANVLLVSVSHVAEEGTMPGKRHAQTTAD